MATLKEIEVRIHEHERRLVELTGDVKNTDKIRVTTNLIEFWNNQKKKALRIENNKKTQL